MLAEQAHFGAGVENRRTHRMPAQEANVSDEKVVDRFSFDLGKIRRAASNAALVEIEFSRVQFREARTKDGVRFISYVLPH